MLEIAKILKPQGIKGEVKAMPLTNVLAVFKLMDRTLKLTRSLFAKGFCILNLPPSIDGMKLRRYEIRASKLRKKYFKNLKKKMNF